MIAMGQERRIPAHQDGVHFEELAAESLLFNETTRKTIYLNEAASAIWKLCDGTRSVEELVDILQQAYSGAPHDFAADVHAALASLFAEGVLKWVDVEQSGA
jgi:hypothetical protein